MAFFDKFLANIDGLKPLVPALHDVDDRVRYAALEALKNSGDMMR